MGAGASTNYEDTGSDNETSKQIPNDLVRGGEDRSDDEKELGLEREQKTLNSALYGTSEQHDNQFTNIQHKKSGTDNYTVSVSTKSEINSKNIVASSSMANTIQDFDSFSVDSTVDLMLKSKKNKIPTSASTSKPPVIAIREGKEEKSIAVVDDAEDVTDSNPMNVLFQFIPYYGQGDPANDSMVRATLKGLPVEDIDYRDSEGNTLLLLACQYRCEDLVRIMLNKGADPNAINMSGACCLHFACYKDSASKAIAKALLQNGANPEVSEPIYGCTPLHYCASFGDTDFCKMLISYGAQVSTYDHYNYTAVDYAREAGNALVARYLQVQHRVSCAAR